MARKTKTTDLTFEEMTDEQLQSFKETTDIGLPSVEADYVEDDFDGEWYNYIRVNLNELEDGDEYEGKPLLLPVEKVQFDEDEAPRYRARLLLIDTENEEYLQINLNLKQEGDIQTNVHNASSLYALIGGIQNLNNPQWTQMFNRIKKINLEQWRDYLDTKQSMNVKVVEKHGSSFSYNSFRITQLS
jgi:hypothetical protein